MRANHDDTTDGDARAREAREARAITTTTLRFDYTPEHIGFANELLRVFE